MRRLMLTVALVAALVLPLAAVDGDKAAYIGGTLSNVKEKSEGTFVVSGPTEIVFTIKKQAPITIPYSAVDGLEYGQKAGRRVGVAIAISPLALFSKKRNHYLTITFKDASGMAQSAVFELGKDLVRTTLTVLQTRTGKEIEYQDDEARKASKG